jgi:YVTN family beta-propeller protein
MNSRTLLTCLLAIVSGAQAVHAETYRLVDKFPIGGEGKWDYPALDPASHRLYLSRATHVLVVDTGNGRVVGEIADTPGVHGIAIASDLGRGYISVGKSNQVKVFDTNTLKVLATLEVGSKPDAILYDEPSHQVFAFNGHSSNVSVIDAKALATVATITLGGAPEFAQSDGNGAIFVNIESKNELAALDARQHKVIAHWPLPGCEGPTGLALDTAHHRSFSVCANAKMTILDTLTGQAIATLPIGAHTDGAAFDKERQDAFSANGDGTLTVVHESDANHFAVAQTVATAPGARTIALDSTSHKLYLPTASFAPVAGAKGDSDDSILPGTFVVLIVGSPVTP